MSRSIPRIRFYRIHLMVAIILMLTNPFSGEGSLKAQGVSDTLSGNAKDKSEIIRSRKSDSLRLQLHHRQLNTGMEFYRKLETSRQKSFFTRHLYPFLFKSIGNSGQGDEETLSDTIPYRNLQGKIIRTIRLYKSDVFGSSVFDTALKPVMWTDKVMNRLHFNTHHAIIRSYLQFSEGEPLDPLKLADNERILRQTDIFEDARIVVENQPASDSVDILVITRDVFPVGFDLKIRNARSSSLRLYNRNILGLGQMAEQSFDINTGRKPAIRFNDGGFTIRNIRQTYTDFRFSWETTPENNAYHVGLDKPYLSPDTKLIGGIEVTSASVMIVPGSQADETTLKYSSWDLWGGYAFVAGRPKPADPERTVMAITGRYYKRDGNWPPSLVLQPSDQFVSKERYLASLSLIRSGYRRTNMIYGFGRTEDIPSGYMARLTIGRETDNNQKRYYSGLKVVTGRSLQKNGFVYAWIEGGGFYSGKSLSDGAAGLGIDYISRLYKSGTYRLRGFFSLSYMAGFNRTADTRLELKNSDYMNVFRLYEISGDQRLTARIEMVLFTPYYLLGFRFAPFTFVETGIIADQSKFIFRGNIVPALGVGIRIKNENLAFSAFQLGLNFYGEMDVNGHKQTFDFSDIPRVNLERFRAESPEIIGYR